jgi:hypothetical protein
MKKDFFTLWDAFPGVIGVYATDIYMWEGDGTPKWVTDEQGKAQVITFWSDKVLTALCRCNSSEYAATLYRRGRLEGSYLIRPDEIWATGQILASRLAHCSEVWWN